MDQIPEITKNSSPGGNPIGVMQPYDPSNPFDYCFTDETYGAKFAEEQRTGRFICLFAVLAIFISCLGLSGLAAFVAERRTREIGQILSKACGQNKI